MKRVKLDRIDQKILRTLQDQGRISNVDLAKQAGISAPPCLRRVRALEEAGYIQGYHANLSAEKLGFTVMSFTHVTLTSHAEADMNAFEDLVRSWPQVRECHVVSGDFDYILKVVEEDWDHYQQFVTKRLMKAPHMGSIKSNIVMRSGKQRPGVPVHEGAIPAAGGHTVKE